MPTLALPSTLARRAAALLAAVAVLLSGCATQPSAHRDPRDPWEPMNRKIFAFDLRFARKVALPIGRTYQRITPKPVQAGIGNFSDNLVYPIVFINDLLQGKLEPFLSDTGRFVLNSTVGIGGLFDPATRAGLRKNDNDFGITLGTWGAGPGPYLVLPLAGMSTLRDASSKVPDWFLSPTYYIDTAWIWLSMDAVYLLDLDSRTLLPAYDLLESQHPFDEYAFARNAYLQQREYRIHGNSAKSQEQQELELEKSLQDSGSDDDSTPDTGTGQRGHGSSAPPPASPPKQ
ncbi:MAG: MlaA family lipoprotein [Steroidobacteraceae bacterium]